MATAYVVNGTGRCGTTLMYHFLLKHHANGGFVKDLRTLDSAAVRNNIVYKTHSLHPFADGKKNVKVLFLFGNIYNTVLSYKRPHVWSDNMLKHLSADDNIGKNHLEQDIFGFGRYFRQWYRKHGYPVMFARYEKMYDNLDAILDFCGVRAHAKKFPAFTERATDWASADGETREKIVRIYGKDNDFADKIPDIKIF